MKFIFLTFDSASRVAVRLSSGTYPTLYFTQPEPPKQTLVTVEMPGLRSASEKAVIEWLTEHTPAAARAHKRREIDTIPGSAWRPTVMEDFIDAANFQSVYWHLRQRLPLSQHRDFFDRWLPRARHLLSAASRAEQGKPLIRALNDALKVMGRVMPMAGLAEGRVTWERDEQQRLLDEATVRELLAERPRDLARLLRAATKIKTDHAARRLLTDLAYEYKRDQASEEQIEDLLTRIRRSSRLRQIAGLSGGFWSALQPMVRLQPNTRGEVIDISEAKEVTVAFNWPVYEARRLGVIVPGRTALFLKPRAEDGRATFIRAERKLKFKVRAAKGRLEKFGNTLTMGGSENSMHDALVEVDRLDTLANVDPDRALLAVADQGLPADHPVFAAAAKARVDRRYGRILADILIELCVGVDADVARRLARAQARANRR